MLRRKDSGESDRALTLLTRELGKLEVIAKGARKGGSRLAGSSEPLVHSQMALAEGRRRRYMTQVQPRSSFPGIRADYSRLSAGLALAELFAAVTPHDRPSEELFDLLLAALNALAGEGSPFGIAIWTELRLLEEEGLQPSWASPSKMPKGGAAWVSPMAGGTVPEHESLDYPDRFKAPVSALQVLEACAQLVEPPLETPETAACLKVLLPFLESAAQTSLPASRALVSALRMRE